jgi:hypothetical protein
LDEKIAFSTDKESEKKKEKYDGESSPDHALGDPHRSPWGRVRTGRVGDERWWWGWLRVLGSTSLCRVCCDVEGEDVREGCCCAALTRRECGC